jgi:uncharacterized protein YjiS (DUF1127 family)
MLERNNSVPLSSFFQAERQARIERRLVIKAWRRRTMRRFAERLRALGLWSIRLASDLAAKRALRSAIRELHQLDDRMLRDIGITRCEIESAARQSLLHAEATDSINTIGAASRHDSGPPNFFSRMRSNSIAMRSGPGGQDNGRFDRTDAPPAGG